MTIWGLEDCIARCPKDQLQASGSDRSVRRLQGIFHPANLACQQLRSVNIESILQKAAGKEEPLMHYLGLADGNRRDD